MTEPDAAATTGWRFFIDRGGTFTDVVALGPDGARHVAKVLSDDVRHGEDAALHAMTRIAGGPSASLGSRVAGVRMGTTVATNALLERRGERTCLAITRGFGDALRIGFQDRPELFALAIVKPEPLFERVVEVAERTLADGTVRLAPSSEPLRSELRAAVGAGCRSLAVVLAHGYAFPAHERIVAELGREVGFEHVSVSHEVAPEPGLVARGDTTCVDAHLTPLLVRHVARLRAALGEAPELRFMASSGGLLDARRFSGKDAILSGPAGGVVAAAAVARELGFDQAIGFDMGGTSTDVSRWSAADGVARTFEKPVAGVRLRAPMVDVVTVAAGGGSVLGSTERRFTVGPTSAGARPGPAGYRAGGPATVTDANAVLGRIQPDWFPRVFGPDGEQAFDVGASRAALRPLAERAGRHLDATAAGFVAIANERMAQAIRQVSVARGRDVRDHALVCFGGAGAQHACAIADLLGIRHVVLHPLAGVLSAHGMGLANAVREAVEPVLQPLDEELARRLQARHAERASELADELAAEGIPPEAITRQCGLDVRYRGVEHALHVSGPEEASSADWRAAFEVEHERLFGFVKTGHPLEVTALRVTVSGELDRPAEPLLEEGVGAAPARGRARVGFAVAGAPGTVRRLPTPVLRREDLRAGHVVEGPALVMEDVSTILVEPGWRGRVESRGALLLERVEPATGQAAAESPDAAADPVGLEIFASRFMGIAEQMGETLRRVAHSTNIKERLDFSCALFTADGRLVANAPHVPVHLGAMGETVRAILAARRAEGLEPGLAVASNDPFHGGSHLPDLTVVSPVFVAGQLRFFVANRGHHADVGGTRPGSMPPAARSIEEEGVRLHDVTLVRGGVFAEDEVRRLLAAGRWPVRDPDERVADLRSQVAANAVGVRLLQQLCASGGGDEAEGAEEVAAWMTHVLADAAAATREMLAELGDGEHAFDDALDDGARVAVRVTLQQGRAVFDFTGTSRQVPGNLNAPRAVSKAAVLYVVRSLIGRRIPLNDGCLEPLSILIPRGTLLDPVPPAAVAGGNVETSQRIADVLLGALGAAAASQGTMNNVTFGDETFGYYETIGGGAGAGPGFPGASGVHVHLTNTRITDAEVLERRHPVVVREFALRRGTGGAGRWRGGDGLVRSIEFLQPMDVGILSERRVLAPFGLRGGAPGARGRNAILRADGRREELGGKAESRVGPGDVLVIETPGGGGYGSPD